MKIRNEERQFTQVKTLTHQGYTFIFATAPAEINGITFDEVYWCTLNPTLGTKSDESGDETDRILDNDQLLDDYWTALTPLNCATETRVIGMNLLSQEIPGEDDKGRPLTSASLTQANPFVVVSDGDYVYVFRTTSLDMGYQATSGDKFPAGLLVDRFIFQRENVTLSHATETRYIRSENADVPASDNDSLGGQTMDGELFIEPTFLLPLGLELAPDDEFSVVRVAVDTNAAVWHIFAPSGNNILSFSIPSTLLLPFDVSSLNGFNIFSNKNKLSYPLITPSAKYQPTYNDQQLTVTNISSTVYYQQEPAQNKDGDNLSMMTNAKVFLTLSGNSTNLLVVDLELGINGRLAGSSPTEWMDPSVEPNILQLSDAPFFGTALELNGRSDYISLPNTDARGNTFEIWIKPYADPKEYQSIIELQFGDNTSCGLCLTDDLRLGLFSLDNTSNNGMYKSMMDRLPPLPSHVWAHLTFSFNLTADDLNLRGYLNGYLVGSFVISAPTNRPTQVTVGGSLSTKAYYFKGAISEVRTWNLEPYDQNLFAYRSIDVLNPPEGVNVQHKDKIVAVFPLNEGKGNELFNQITGGSSATCYGGSWVSAASPSRISMPLACKRDKGLLAVRGTVLPGVQTQGAADLLASADGLIRMSYCRKDTHWGSLHYSARTQRAQLILSWQSDSEKELAAKLRFMALISGTTFNLCSITISDDKNHKGMISITMSEDTTSTKKGLLEQWTNLPRKVSSIIDIINGRMPDSIEQPDAPRNYNYKENLIRLLNGTPLPEEELPDRPFPHASLLFAVSAIYQLDEDRDQSLPNEITANTLQSTWLACSDPRWLLDPIPVAVHQPLFKLSDDSNEKLQIDGDITLEAWAYVQPEINGTILSQGDGNSPYLFGLINGRLYASKNKDDQQVWAQSVDAVVTKSTGSWTHLAASYHASWGLHLHDESYIKCGKLQIEPREAITVEAWVCPDEESINSGVTIPILSQWSEEDENRKFKLAIDPKGIPTFQAYDGKRKHNTSTSDISPLNPGQWTHLSGVYRADGTQNILYFPSEKNSYAAVLENDGISRTMTIEMWIRPALKITDRSTLISCVRNEKDKSNSFLEVAIGTDGKLKLYYYSKNKKLEEISTGLTIINKNDENALVDHHVAIVFDWKAKIITIYLDGIQHVLPKLSIDPNFDTTKDAPLFGWLIGSAAKNIAGDEVTQTQKHYVGGMWDVRMWTTCRSEQQIIDHMNFPVSTVESGLLGYWKMNNTPVNTSTSSDNDDSDSTTQQMNFKVQPRITNAVNSVSAEVAGSAYYTAVKVKPKVELYVNGQLTVSNTFSEYKKPEKLLTSEAALLIGKKDTNDSPILSAIVDDIRIWNTARLPAQIDYYQKSPINSPTERADLAAYWNFDQGEGLQVPDETGGNPGKIVGIRNINDSDMDVPYWVPTPITSYWTLYVNGQKAPMDTMAPKMEISSQEAWLGSSDGINPFNGYLNEVRLWDIQRDHRAIQLSLNQRLMNDENGLIAYWPCNDNQGSGINLDIALSDRTNNPCDAHYVENNPSQQIWPSTNDNNSNLPYPVPVSDDAQYAINFSNGIHPPATDEVILSSPPAVVELDAASGTVRVGICSDPFSILLNTTKEPDATELVYLGQIQTGARIVGYIEGAPPLPSENMGIEQSSNPDKYLGASSVTLAQGDEVTYSGISKFSWGRAMDLDLTIGAGAKVKAKVESPVSESDTVEGHGKHLVHLKADGDYNIRAVNTAQVFENTNTKSTLVMAGAFEQNLYNIGNFTENQRLVQPRRIYRPNNMGAAIVKSMVADFYAIRSKRTGATVGYIPVPDPKIPLDINVIMFKINPSYIKNGSLDGYIGFDKDIHYKNLSLAEKGSYYKVQEAYATKDKINREQAEYNNYFASLMNTAPDVQLSKKDWLNEVANRSMVNTYVWTADGGLASLEVSEGSSRREALGIDFNVNAKLGYKYESEATVGFMAMSGVAASLDILGGTKIQGIHTFASSDKATFALESKADGEGFLGKLSIPVNGVDIKDKNWGERNPMNGDASYLDPFSDPLTQLLIEKGLVTKIRISYSPDVHTTQYTISSTEEDGMWILEDLAGKFDVKVNESTADFTPRVEAGQYPFNFQTALCPGKVLGYRFMSYYLDPDKENFKALAKANDPNNQIIDQDWLDNPDDPNAVALKDALTRSNEPWRVLHRVTYVNRVPPEKQDTEEASIKHTVIPNQKKRPDSISIARNDLVIRLLLGYDDRLNECLPNIKHSGYPADIAIIDENIALLVDSLHLPKIKNTKLFNQLHNYMVSYIATDAEIFTLTQQAEDCSSSKNVNRNDNHADTDGGKNVGNVQPNGELTYDYINIPRTGKYLIEFRVSTDRDNIKISLQIDADGEKSTLNVPNTKSWKNYETIGLETEIEKGQHSFIISTTTGGWNLDWWRITAM